MELSIQERLKDLRVERGLTLEQLEEQVNLSKSALGSYEAKDFRDISHYAIVKLAKFYGVTADYLLGLSQTRNHPNADLADLRLSDDMIELLKSGLVDNALLCELAVHPDFPRLMADLEIYVNGIAGKQVQSANAIVDAVSATIMKQHNPGLTDPQLRQLIAAHIDDDSFCRYVIQQDINKIALDLREAHKDDFFLGQLFQIQFEPLTDKRQSRLLRVAVWAGGFLGGLQKIFQRIVLRDAEKIVLMYFS